MATIPEIEARIHALWATGEARTREESVELGQLLTALEAEMPRGDFYRQVLEVLHISTRDAQPFMAQSRTSQGAESRPAPEASRGARPDTGGRLRHLLPVTLGHLVGGAVMGAAVYWHTHVSVKAGRTMPARGASHRDR